MDLLNQLSDDYSGQAHFLMVYIREAHASDEWATFDNKRLDIKIAQPKTKQERLLVAQKFVNDFQPRFPVLVDEIDDRVNQIYGGWPERLYVLDEKGVIVYQAGEGPWGFKPRQAQKALDSILSP